MSRKLLKTAPLLNNVARLPNSRRSDDASDQNDIGSDFEAMLQIRYTLESRYDYADGCMSCAKHRLL
jgi:hypothetical protein